MLCEEVRLASCCCYACVAGVMGELAVRNRQECLMQLFNAAADYAAAAMAP